MVRKFGSVFSWKWSLQQLFFAQQKLKLFQALLVLHFRTKLVIAKNIAGNQTKVRAFCNIKKFKSNYTDTHQYTLSLTYRRTKITHAFFHNILSGFHFSPSHSQICGEIWCRLLTQKSNRQESPAEGPQPRTKNWAVTEEMPNSL